VSASRERVRRRVALVRERQCARPGCGAWYAVKRADQTHCTKSCAQRDRRARKRTTQRKTQ
jgi:hypothetical protein